MPTDRQDVDALCLVGAKSAGPAQTCGARLWSSNWRAKVYRHGARYAGANFYTHGQALVVGKAKDNGRRSLRVYRVGFDLYSPRRCRFGCRRSDTVAGVVAGVVLSSLSVWC